MVPCSSSHVAGLRSILARRGGGCLPIMNMILKVTKHPSGVWIYVSENRSIYFKREPTVEEQAAMGSSDKFYAVFNLENGQSRFTAMTKPRGW